MSTPNENSGPYHGAAPTPPGYEAPPGYFAPPSAPQQESRQESPQPTPSNNFRFELPQDMPTSLNEVLPKGGFSGIFKVAELPSQIKVSYILWLVTAGLGLISGVVMFFINLLLLGTHAGTVLGMVTSLISLALVVVVVLSAMKLKEGRQWARLALSGTVVANFVLVFLGVGGVGLLGIVATVFMWLPESSAWLNSRSQRLGH